MYAVVDIETTGGYAAANGITEIAIRIHDGEKVTKQFETLVNPRQEIPYFIRGLTGITDEMVCAAPSFSEVAATVYDLLKDNIFVAHNVNFDYSFLRYHLTQAGYELTCKKLCTVKLGRKIFPGLPSYNLRKLCTSLQIPLVNHHRAGGDVDATSELLTLYIQNDREGHIYTSLHGKTKEHQLPPAISRIEIDKLPTTPGVYYFKGRNGKPLYIGKAVNIRKRVLSHFTGNNAGRQRQEFLKNIHSIDYKECGSELVALILEAVEIKQFWPIYNRALKRFEQAYGLFMFEDQKGYLRLAIDKRTKYSAPVYTFNNLLDGYTTLIALVKEFQLCPKLCFIQKNKETCTGITEEYCKGACKGDETGISYNDRVRQAIEKFKSSLPSFLLTAEGRTNNELVCVLLEKGVFLGLGYFKSDVDIRDMEYIKSNINQYSSNQYIVNLISDYALRYPNRIVNIN
ncbi:exonuclease domain-containing protein [Rubrolithibacter danxiaensis]|uniref:exonuclease domain-containing protein n=1 Tax=Rubrolithibacter danxiaensis TaxID=3390805 RepID=UPI003BF886AA